MISSKLALAYAFTLTALFFGWLVGCSGIDQYGGGYLWLALACGCPFLAGVAITNLIHSFN